MDNIFRQVALADVVIVNKTDLIADAELTDLADDLRYDDILSLVCQIKIQCIYLFSSASTYEFNAFPDRAHN